MTNPPPDITVTRDDVLALPLTAAALMPDEGREWCVIRVRDGFLRWAEFFGSVAQADRVWPPPASARYARLLTDAETFAAERVWHWQVSLASDAALADIAAEPRSVGALCYECGVPDSTHPPTPRGICENVPKN
jgi:hypothetical protein